MKIGQGALFVEGAANPSQKYCPLLRCRFCFLSRVLVRYRDNDVGSDPLPRNTFCVDPGLSRVPGSFALSSQLRMC